MLTLPYAFFDKSSSKFVFFSTFNIYFTFKVVSKIYIKGGVMYKYYKVFMRIH